MSLTDRVNELPRVVRWALGAAVALLAFVAWDDHVRPIAAAWSREADAIERQVEQAREAEQLVRAIRGRDDLIRDLGPVEMPGGDDEGRQALHSLVVDVIRSYRTVRNDSFTLSGGADRLPAAVSQRLLAASGQAGQRLVRISGDLRFDAEPEDAVAIVADLEARPGIESVSLVRMLRKDGRTVGVTITLNAWVVQSPRRLAGR